MLRAHPARAPAPPPPPPAPHQVALQLQRGDRRRRAEHACERGGALVADLVEPQVQLAQRAGAARLGERGRERGRAGVGDRVL